MNRHLLKLMPLLLACVVQGAPAAVLSIKLSGGNSTLTTTVGSEFDANIFIDSIPDFGGFELTLTYDSTKMSALSLTSGSIFGADTDTSSSPFVPGSGSANIFEFISGTSPATAGLNINAPTLLATVHFKALTTGVNNLLTIANPTPNLSDFSGNSVGGTIQTAFVTINPSAVPLPASFLMFAPGLLALFRQKAHGKS